MFLRAPEPLSIKTRVCPERRSNPGDPLLKEGIPVPEPRITNSGNFLSSSGRMKSKLTQNGEILNPVTILRLETDQWLRCGKIWVSGNQDIRLQNTRVPGSQVKNDSLWV